MQKRIRKAVIPAAGYGTRFLPVTKAIPKEMIPIVDKPVIQYIVEEALQSGIEEILIITGHGKRAIEDHFDTNIDLELQLRQQGKDQLLHMVQDISSINIHYIRQKHMRGLGDAIRCAESFIDNEPFAVLLGDDVVYNPEQPALKQMMDAFSRLGATILGCQEVPQELVSRYGIVQGQPTDDDRVVKLIDMVEKPAVDEAPSRLAALGRYILTPDIFEILRRVQPGKGGEIQLTDALRLMADREAVYAYTFSGRSYDTGNKLGFLKATVEYALRREDLGDAFREYLRHSLPE
jgi:UTP--glucose-1-phosphate uridylyltransferase